MERKAGSLTAVADAEGRLATDKARIERIVLEELEKIFSGKRSHIFSHRGEQLIKELTTKDKMGWKEWIKESTNPNQHETKVCSKVSEQEIAGIINKLKLRLNAEICWSSTRSPNDRPSQSNIERRASPRGTFSG